MPRVPDDYGSIADPVTEVIDCGGIPLQKNNLVDEEEEEEDHKNLSNTFSYCSTGRGSSLKVKGDSKVVFTETFKSYFDLNEDSIVFFGIVLTWIGFGTPFEIENGLERIVSPYLASGTMR